MRIGMSRLALFGILAFANLASFSAYSHDGAMTMLDACKAECPDAKTEDEAHVCVEKIAGAKKKDKKWKESKCSKAYKEHEVHEEHEYHKDHEKDGHKH